MMMIIIIMIIIIIIIEVLFLFKRLINLCYRRITIAVQRIAFFYT